MALLPPDRERSLLDNFFGIDLRSLALLRIALASALLYDVLDRWTDLRAMYTNFGVLPSDTLIALWGRGAVVSPFYHLSDYPDAVAVLFAIQVCAAVAMGIGWRTRWAGGLGWFLLAAIQVRNPMAAFEGCDKFLPQILLLALLLPIEAKWSLDAGRRANPIRGDRVLSIASAAVILQLCNLYWVTGFMKTGETWQDGTAVHYALHLDYWTLPFGIWLRDQPTLMAMATWGTLLLERFGPFLAFVPFRTAQFRMLLIGLFVSFHLGLASTMNVGPFPFYTLIAWPVLLPSWFRDEWLPRLRAIPSAISSRETPAAPLRSSKWVQVAAAGLIVLMVIQTAGHPGWVPDPISIAAQRVGKVLRFGQNWKMFSPNPDDRDVWPVMRGELASGRLVDPLTGQPAMREKPELLSSSYPSFRWRLYYLYLMRSVLAGNERMREPLHLGVSEYFCRMWNAEHSGTEVLKRIEVEYWTELNDAPYPIERIRIYQHTCDAA